MRIAIREQLALLVVLCCLLCLATLSISTWVAGYRFVDGISSRHLALTASLYGRQLNANLILVETSMHAMATRIVVQNALQRYNNGNNTMQNWVNSILDLQAGMSSAFLAASPYQARLYGKNGTGQGGPYPLLNVTTQGVPMVKLNGTHANGTDIYLGDEDGGYPERLYPHLNFTTHTVNATYNATTATYHGEVLNQDTLILMGPWHLNSTFSMCSVTLPIVNVTAANDILGWMSIVIDADAILRVQDSAYGIGDTGDVLIIGPRTYNNKFGEDQLYNSTHQASESVLDDIKVRLVAPPIGSSTKGRIRQNAYYSPNNTFTLGQYPAVFDAVTQKNGGTNNEGSMLDTHNEEGDHISVGFAFVSSELVEWVLVVEKDYGEIMNPNYELRNIILACCFGTLGIVILLVFPAAHYSVRPIRRLREATIQSVDPYMGPGNYGPGNGDHSPHSSLSGFDNIDRSDQEALQSAKKPKRSFGRWLRYIFLVGRTDTTQSSVRSAFRIPQKVEDGKHVIKDELTDLTGTFNAMVEELSLQYERLEEKVKTRTEELEKAKIAAEAANESKTLFIANISHELKTPLNGILGMCAVCMHEEDQTKLKRSLGIIYKSGDLLLNLLTDLLTFSKNQIGQHLSLDEKEFRLADISSQILSIFDKQAKEASVKLKVIFEGPNESLDTASGTPGKAGYGPFGTGRVKDMHLWGDQHRILQVVINLVSNSLKFTPPGGSVTVYIRCNGEAELERAPSSRKGSHQSKRSKGSKGSKSTKKGRSSRMRLSRATSAESDSSATSGDERGKKTPEVSSKEAKNLPQVFVRERSMSPTPLNARSLMFEFVVEDTGPGIPANQQQKVFEPFVQGDLGLSKKYGGTGLGLSICSQLATLMRGSITLQSEENRGSTFILKIPLRFVKERADSTASSSIPSSVRNSLIMDASGGEKTPNLGRSNSGSDLSTHSAPTAAASNNFEAPSSKPRLVGLSQPFFAASPSIETPKEQIEAMERAAVEATKNGGKVRVLVAEDNKVNQEVVLRMLKLEDIYDVTVAKDGQEALDFVKESMANEQIYNLIFMDIQMPNLDGLQSTRRIREMGYSAPIIALTAFAEESNIRECLDSGMNYFLPKPIRRPALKQVLKQYCATIPEANEDGETPPAVNTHQVFSESFSLEPTISNISMNSERTETEKVEEVKMNGTHLTNGVTEMREIRRGSKFTEKFDDPPSPKAHPEHPTSIIDFQPTQ